MYQDTEELHDVKGRGQPPPYTPSDLPQGMRPANDMSMQIGQPMHGEIGQPIPIQHVVMMQPIRGMYHAHAPAVVPMVVGNQMGPNPQYITCQSCKEAIVTRVEARANTRTHFFAGLICLMCCLPCVFIPYCLDSCRNADHYCPNCNAYIGSYVH